MIIHVSTEGLERTKTRAVLLSESMKGPFRVPYSGIGRDSAGSRGMESGYLAEIGTAGSGNATGWDCFSEMRTFLIGNSLG